MKSYLTLFLFFYILHVATVSGMKGGGGGEEGGGLSLSSSSNDLKNGFNFGSSGNNQGQSSSSGKGGKNNGKVSGKKGGGRGSNGSFGWLSDLVGKTFGGGSGGRGKGAGSEGKGAGGGGGRAGQGKGNRRGSNNASKKTKTKGSLGLSFGMGSRLEKFIDSVSGRFSSLGDNTQDAIGRLLSAIPGGDVDLSGNQLGGFSGGSVSKSINIKSVFTGILKSPIKIVTSLAHFIVNSIWSIVTLQFKVLKIPLTVVSSVVSIIRTIVTAIVTRILNVILKIQSINVVVVSKAIGVVKSTLGFIIKTIASVQITGLKTVFSVIGFSRDRIKGIANTIFNLAIKMVTTIAKVSKGGVKVLQLDKIIKLPVIRNIVNIFSGGFKVGMSIILKQVFELSQFVDQIIFDHQDFFMPIFSKMFNTILAIRDALARIFDGGQNSGIMTMIGHLKILLAPLKDGGWEWTGLSGKTFHGSLSLNAICKKYGAPQYNPGPLIANGNECSGGPQKNHGGISKISGS